MEEKVEYDEVVECQHSYDKRCFTSLTTVFKPEQEEKCSENYVKDCFIKYEKDAVNTTTRVCRKPLVRDCDVETNEETCTTQYEAECVTKEVVQEVEDDVPECETVVEERCHENAVGYTTSEECNKWPKKACSIKKKLVRKVFPETKCDKLPVVMCGPKGCGFSEGAEQCREKVKTLIFDKPEEVCELDPRVICKFVTKLVPQLKEVESCIDVPKEICVRKERNPRKVKYPVIKNWCYTLKCPDKCVEASKKGLCLSECSQYKDKTCCAPTLCPRKCLVAAHTGQCLPRQCDQHGYLPGCQCTQRCPDKCLQAARTGQCSPQCQEHQHLPDCQCTKKCPGECRPFMLSGECTRLPFKCLAYADLPDCQCVQKCPSACVQAVQDQDCSAFDQLDCSTFSQLSGCQCSQDSCSPQCSQAARWGKCPQDCKKHSGDPACCAPDCPAKCTSKRQGECSVGGVEECGNIPGCCPDKYDLLFGDVAFGGQNAGGLGDSYEGI